MSDYFEHGDQYFKCGYYLSKRVIEHTDFSLADGGWKEEETIAEEGVELHICKSKSDI